MLVIVGSNGIEITYVPNEMAESSSLRHSVRADVSGISLLVPLKSDSAGESVAAAVALLASLLISPKHTNALLFELSIQAS